jgi:hypothetical protein
MSYDLIELTLNRLGEQLPERLSPCLESHQTDRRSDKIRSGISRRITLASDATHHDDAPMGSPGTYRPLDDARRRPPDGEGFAFATGFISESERR